MLFKVRSNRALLSLTKPLCFGYEFACQLSSPALFFVNGVVTINIDGYKLPVPGDNYEMVRRIYNMRNSPLNGMSGTRRARKRISTTRKAWVSEGATKVGKTAYSTYIFWMFRGDGSGLQIAHI